ncbi:unnamed protein product [Ostreobium quekettii]|uniref:Uncharacterized protein n=1 Tax=Ostreobium quekettii TaxID=121088 RepID=A0A8S1IXN9_9CHLO|nr:unnamed protein product [Ostreobium quekettii]|eukprot:evm.model.scf_1657.1 EVM.evm.TU.scf_1657.1   scf_1657:14417-19579(+)
MFLLRRAGRGFGDGRSCPRAIQDGARRLSTMVAQVAPESPSGGDAAMPADPTDPFVLVRGEIDAVSERIRRDVVSEIPALARAAEYFLRVGAEGKRVRPSMLLLLSSALSPVPPSPEDLIVDPRPPSAPTPEVRRRQQRIAEITEVMHVASLLHDDVIDGSATRRGQKSLNVAVGNKLAILAGDFLLARASVSLAALREAEVIMLMSQVLEHLVSGEIMQMTSAPEDLMRMDHYKMKTYRKTAAMMSNSAKSAAILGGHSREVINLASDFGRHLGMAFQVVDDILDFTASSDMLGKPALNDLKSGIATAPVLFAAEDFPALAPLICRKFQDVGDIEEALRMVENSSGIQRARELAKHHACQAADAVSAPV